MKAAIFTLNTGLYKAKKDSAAATALKRMLEQVGFEVKASGVLPEDKKVALAVLKRLADTGAVELILTTGATGIRKRDCAPDVVMEVSERLLPEFPRRSALIIYGIRKKRFWTAQRRGFGTIR